MKKCLLFNLVIMFGCLFSLSCQKAPPDFTVIPSKWVIPSRKAVQKIEDDITSNLRKKFGGSRSFNDIYPEPDLKFASMGPNKEPILTVTLAPFKMQGGARVLVYRLNETELELVQEFNCMTKDGCEFVPIHLDNALLIHDDERSEGKGCLYFLRGRKLEKVFEYFDTDYQYQNDFTFRTKLTFEDNNLFLYRWDSTDGKRGDDVDDFEANGRFRKAEVNWDETTGRFKQGNFQAKN